MTVDARGPGEPPARRRIGRVIAGGGAQYLVLIEREQDGTGPISAGDVLVIGVGRGDPLTGTPAPLCVAAVTALSVPAPQVERDAEEIRIAEVDLYGALTPDGFARGVGCTPALGDAVCLASPADLTALYAGGVPVATLTGQAGQPGCVDTEGVRAGFGIVGSAGVGKSASLAVLVRALLRARSKARPVLLDARDEYARSFGRAASVIRPGAGFLPHWLLTFEELCWTLSLCGGALLGEERALLAEAIPAARIRMMQRSGEALAPPVGLDAPLPYRVTDVTSFLDRAHHGQPAGGSDAYKRLRGRLGAAAADPRLALVFGAAAATDTLAQLIGDVFGLREGAPPMTVVQLGALGHGLDRLVACVLCRLALVLGQSLGEGLREGTGGAKPALMLMEDAERYAPASEVVSGAEQLSREAVLALASASGSVGVALGLVTARPTLVHEQVLRALPTLFVHRLASDAERERVALVLPEGSPGAVAGVGTQRPRDCVVLGRGVPAPGRYTMATLPDAAIPRRAAPADAPRASGARLAQVLVDRWRFGEAASGLPAAGAPCARPPSRPALRSVPAA